MIIVIWPLHEVTELQDRVLRVTLESMPEELHRSGLLDESESSQQTIKVCVLGKLLGESNSFNCHISCTLPASEYGFTPRVQYMHPFTFAWAQPCPCVITWCWVGESGKGGSGKSPVIRMLTHGPNCVPSQTQGLQVTSFRWPASQQQKPGQASSIPSTFEFWEVNPGHYAIYKSVLSGAACSRITCPWRYVSRWELQLPQRIPLFLWQQSTLWL